MRLLKICCSEWINENRDKRELSVCNELHIETLVLAKGLEKDKGADDIVDGFSVKRYSTRPLGRRVPNSINRVLALFTWANYARKLTPDIISGHDLWGLTIGWLSNWFRRDVDKAKLVYDSHEFEIGRNRKRNKLSIYLIKKWEGFLIKKCDFSIMVNDSIADEVRRIHRLKTRPIVVRNVPTRWDIDEKECIQIKMELLKGFKVPVKQLIMYHGVIGPGRGIEDILLSLNQLKDVGLCLLGRIYSENYYASLQKLILDYNVSDKVIFHDAVNIDILWKYIGAADLGICYIVPTTKSYYFALPNKLFENIQAKTPVIVSDLPEMRRIIDEYSVGEVCVANNADALKNSIRHILENEEYRDKLRKNTLFAREVLCWENEKLRLIDAYEKLIKHEEEVR